MGVSSSENLGSRRVGRIKNKKKIGEAVAHKSTHSFRLLG